MKHYYTNERNHQILIALLKAHDIRNIIVSPGSCNSVFVGSIQSDSFFNLYSAVDERAAAYIACGLAFKTGEPVVLNCTGATAARNYMSGATEAYYSKLPILIVTSSQPNNRIGQLVPQVTDRTSPPRDTCRYTTTLPLVKSSDEEWECEVKANTAILELRRHGGGPVHINLETSYSYNNTTALTSKTLPSVRKISRYVASDEFPILPKARIGIVVGLHKNWDSELTAVVEHFCSINNAVVFCEHTSNYNGKFRIPFSLFLNQAVHYKEGKPAFEADLLIHIGEMAGEEGSLKMIRGKETWRVSADGEVRDPFRNLTAVFEMSEIDFFEHYLRAGKKRETRYYNDIKSLVDSCEERCYNQVDLLPFSNVWIASQMSQLIPDNSTVVLGILNSLRAWNSFPFKGSISFLSPTGGFGIDGLLALTLGVSLANTDNLCYCVLGDLAFFYDLNTLGNRHIGNNIRILLINNGLGVEFKKTYSLTYRLMEGEDLDDYISAKGHFGVKSATVVRHFANDMGFDYISASNKDEFLEVYIEFISEKRDKPIIFECFVDDIAEVEALNIIHNRD